MKTVVAYPGMANFAQQVARAFLEADALVAFVTTFAYEPRGALARALSVAPGLSKSLRRELERRAIRDIPSESVHTMPFWEIARTLASRAGASPIFVDRIWDVMARAFDRTVAQRYLKHTAAVYAYEYTALATFQRARIEGVATLLDLPSLNSRAFEALSRAEQDRFPELKTRRDTYFAGKFEERQARRDAEIALANVIVANSTLTKRSHVEGGADGEKIVVVPLAAPPCVPELSRALDAKAPLEVIWAGNFSLGKGAHYFLEAWRLLDNRRHARATVFGPVTLPQRVLHPLPPNVSMRGAVPQPQLFAAFDRADVLIFPTLSDGFGMVVTEAFSRGLPVITTSQAGASDLVKLGENGFIVPAGDARALADVIGWCLDNRAMLHEMRAAALRTAQEWQWPHYRRALIERVDGALRKSGYSPSFQLGRDVVGTS